MALILTGCVSGSVKPVVLSNELPGDLPNDLKNRFEVLDPGAAASSATPSPAVSAEVPDGAESKGRKKGKTRKTAAVTPPPVVAPSPKFIYPMRRPAKDPIWLGEKLTFGIYYFGVSAGDFSLEVLPFKKINERKVYHIRGQAISSPVFSIFYRLNDVVESFFDYEGSFSHRFHLVLDETKQRRDALELNDSEKKQTYYWNRWEPRDANYTESRETGTIESFSQDTVSSLYYIRTVPLSVGAVVTFPVVSEGKTFEAVCTVLRKESMDSPMGKVDAFVIQPEMKLQGVLKKGGESFLWVTDDERRIPLKLEAKVKVGTVVAKLRLAELGTPPASGPR